MRKNVEMTLLVFDMGGSAVKYGLRQDEQLSDKGTILMTPDYFGRNVREEFSTRFEIALKSPLEGVAHKPVRQER